MQNNYKILILFINIIFLYGIIGLNLNINNIIIPSSNSQVQIAGLKDDISKLMLRDLIVSEAAAQLAENTSENSSEPKIILTSHKYIEKEKSRYDNLIGQVKNIGNGSAESIKVIFTYYNGNGDVVGTGNTNIHLDKLAPGQKAPFSESRNKQTSPGMEYYEVSLSWDNPDGTEEYLENVEITKDVQEKMPVIENDENKGKIEKLPFFSTETKDIDELDEDEDEKDEDEKNNEEDNENEGDEDDD
jgi:hypothetical protein